VPALSPIFASQIRPPRAEDSRRPSTIDRRPSTRAGGEPMTASLARIFQIVWKEVIQIRRDRRMFALVLMMPLMELMIFGYVVSTDINNIDLAVCDYSHTAESRAYVDQLVRSGYFRISAECKGVNEVNQLLDRGTVHVALAIPPDFADRLKRQQPAEVMAAVDGSNSNTAMIASSYLEQVTLTQAVDVVFPDSGGETHVVHQPIVSVEPRVWFNPELRSVNFMVPGIICVLLMESLVIMTAVAIVKEKERGTMEQLIVTPIRSYELILGKAIPFIGLGYINVAVVILAGTFWFQVPIRGSLPLLLGLTGLFILTCLGMGLMASTVSNTQQQASMAGQFIILPNMFFSGFMFPIASMPPLVQKFTYLIPLRYYIAIARGIFLKGAGFTELRDEAAILVVYGVVILSLATLFFRRQLRGAS
jgi:drug efflux transport system permease protein